jgi:hypothetical protein
MHRRRGPNSSARKRHRRAIGPLRCADAAAVLIKAAHAVLRRLLSESIRVDQKTTDDLAQQTTTHCRTLRCGKTTTVMWDSTFLGGERQSALSKKNC